MAEQGAVTAEYVVGTLAASAVAGVLVSLATDGWFLDLLWDLIEQAFRPGVFLDHVRRLPDVMG